jgi:asparagine synthase (glutamine-hydrolysing)
MICGYVAQTQQPWIESIFSSENLDTQKFIFKRDKLIAWFSIGKEEKVIHDGNLLFISDGVPVFKHPLGNYCTWDTYKEDLKKQMNFESFPSILEKTVSNINSVFFDACEGKLWLASNRAAAGRIYYRQIPKGLIFSNNFLCISKIGQLNVNWDAVYAIIKYGASPDPLTISKDVFSIPVAHYGVCSTSTFDFSIYPYFKFDFSQRHNGNLDIVRKYLLDSAALLASLNASILLSGGVDSTLYAHLLCENAENKIRAFYLCFGEDDPELPFAEKAANEAGCSLEVIEMKDEYVVSSIIEAAETYTHLFSDYSTIPTYYLMRCVRNKMGTGVLIEGTGGDACFGFSTLLNANNWVKAFNTPLFIKKALRELYSASNIWKKNSSFAKYLSAFAACCESDMALSPLVLCPASGLFNESDVLKTSISGHFLRLFNNLTKQDVQKLPFEAIATVSDIAHTCSKMYTAKTYGLFSDKIHVVYPYLWRDILIEQGNISWAVKIRNGIVKWPLKSLLEKYMQKDFIYRKKSAFLPPLERWLMREDVYELIKETLIDHETLVGKVVKQKNLTKLVKQLPRLSKFSQPLCHFLWGTLFTELWLRRTFEIDRMSKLSEKSF